MWGKIDDETYFKCGHCGRVINPYAQYKFIGYPPEAVFYMMPPCTCGHKEWEYTPFTYR